MFISKNEIEEFKNYLTEQGCVVLSPTNEYELIRFRANGEIGIIYEGKRGQTFTGQAETAFKAFKTGQRFIATNRKRRQMTAIRLKLAARDGRYCFWCARAFTLDKLTVEHILNKMHTGTDHLYNLSLACKDCQKNLGNKSIVEKIRLRDANRLEAHTAILKDYTPKNINIFNKIFRRKTI